ncbi:hypothetical protein [Pseudomonas sp. S31]|uniref:hypothetical protein n=1 Tax=Pseudomonas sp. S31 TaxID=1564473 RepID=UPI0019135FA9|nr:hypothetical protein [Pseudomonas sp. S31]
MESIEMYLSIIVSTIAIASAIWSLIKARVANSNAKEALTASMTMNNTIERLSQEISTINKKADRDIVDIRNEISKVEQRISIGGTKNVTLSQLQSSGNNGNGFDIRGL